MKNLILSVVCGALLFAACNSTSNKNRENVEILYKPKYATSFYIEKNADEKLLHVFNPWQGAENMELIYHLYPREKEITAESLPMNYIPVPLQRVVCLSTTHIAYIDCVDETSTIFGVSGAGYVTNEKVQQNFTEGKVKDIGYETLLSYEVIAYMKPDVVFAYGVNGEMNAATNKLNEMGVRVVYLADYLEENILGKAEYMVAMSAFYNKENKAIEQFLEMAEEYEHIVQKVSETTDRPRVILNAPWRDTWYMPGEDNYMNKLLADAGAKVIGLHKGRNSSPISLEAAYTYALQADYWLHPNSMRVLKELEITDKRFAKIPAFLNRKVYNNTRRSTSEGGSDFWESGVVNPHVILQDLVHIFHSEILPEHELVYYEQLQ